MDEYKSVKKYLSKQEIKPKKKIPFTIINRLFLSAILLLICLCLTKVNTDFKEWINKNVYQTNFSFAKINNLYEKYFGDIYPLEGLAVSTEPVFNEQLIYSEKEDYKEGVKLVVGSNYLVPVLESGIVVFIGEKENYGNTIIIQQVDGTDIWYVGVDSSNIKIYDYVEKGNLLGEALSNEIYLYYQKQGEFIDYKDYI